MNLRTSASFLTGQGLFSVLDLVFTFVFFAVLSIYSVKLTLILLASIPVYVVIAALLRPPLRETLKEKFNRGAESQQFLVEAMVGIHTVKASAVEPVMQSQWEEKLAAYVSRSFLADPDRRRSAKTPYNTSIRVTTALILLFGAWAVMDGDLSVGELIAFNMIAGQTIQPILRLSQLWQDFQQVQVSVERLGDILNTAPEYRPQRRRIAAAAARR